MNSRNRRQARKCKRQNTTVETPKVNFGINMKVRLRGWHKTHPGVVCFIDSDPIVAHGVTSYRVRVPRLHYDALRMEVDLCDIEPYGVVYTKQAPMLVVVNPYDAIVWAEDTRGAKSVRLSV